MASRTSRSDLRRAVVLPLGCALLAAGWTVGGGHGGRALVCAAHPDWTKGRRFYVATNQYLWVPKTPYHLM
jgi:hypothetical protein